jgi:hypothetical protein
MAELGSPESPGQLIATDMAAIRSQGVGRVWLKAWPGPREPGLWLLIARGDAERGQVGAPRPLGSQLSPSEERRRSGSHQK